MNQEFLQAEAINIDFFQSLLDEDEIFSNNIDGKGLFRPISLQEEENKLLNFDQQPGYLPVESQVQYNKQMNTMDFSQLFPNNFLFEKMYHKNVEKTKQYGIIQTNRDQENILNFCPLHQYQSTNNMPKFLLKIAKQYFPQDFKDIIQEGKFPNKFYQFFRRVKNRGRSPNLKLLHKLLNMNLFTEADQIANRKVMWHILGKRKKEEIINNNKVLKKRLYSTSAKIFRLRCRNQMLTKRTSLK